MSNGALAGDKLPSRIKILNWGRNESVRGDILLDEVSTQHLSINQRKHGCEKVALDFEHNTAKGSEEYNRTKEPRAVAAYGIPRVTHGDGLYLDNVEWTPEGHANAKNYADLSPAIAMDKDGRVTFLASVALCRNGAVYDLSFFNAEGRAPQVPDHSSTSKTIMPDKIFLTLCSIATALGLPEAATENEVSAQLKTLSALPAKLAALEAKLGNAPAVQTFSATVGEKTITLTAPEITSRFLALENKIETQQKALDDSAKATVISRFAAEGKVPKGVDGKPLDAAALAKLDLPTLQIMAANTPATVPLSARTRQPVDNQKKSEGLTGVARSIAAHQEATAA